MITFLRRKKLGLGSVRGMTAHLNESEFTRTGPRMHRGEAAGYVRNDQAFPTQEVSLLVRWGCTSATHIPLHLQLNTSDSIKRVNDKRGFRILAQDTFPHTVPPSRGTTESASAGSWPMVLRPSKHSQGRNLFVVNTMSELEQTLRSRPSVFANGWYASELIDKVAEYRVYVVSGRVATVARKTPDDPTQVAWNVAQGGRFDVVSWGDWDMEVCKVAIETFKLSGLDFGGVDVMVDRDGRAYMIEINSAPSLPLLSDGSVSYRQKCMANCFKYISEHGKDYMYPDNYGGWRDVIHPAVGG